MGGDVGPVNRGASLALGVVTAMLVVYEVAGVMLYMANKGREPMKGMWPRQVLVISSALVLWSLVLTVGMWGCI